MTARQDAVINELKVRVEKLIKLYTASLEEKEKLQCRITETEEQIATLKNDNKNLNEELKNQKVISAISGGGDSYHAKLKINQLVREIDKCIALLNN